MVTDWRTETSQGIKQLRVRRKVSPLRHLLGVRYQQGEHVLLPQ